MSLDMSVTGPAYSPNKCKQGLRKRGEDVTELLANKSGYYNCAI